MRTDRGKKATRNCPVCGAYNEPDRAYCSECWSYLRNAHGPKSSASLFEEERENERKVARCPRCGAIVPAPDGILPPLCGQCNYFFQIGIDQLLPAYDSGTPQGLLLDRDNAPAPDKKNPSATLGSPMPSVGTADMSTLRLLPVSTPVRGPLSIRPEGMNLSSGRAKVHISRAATGWYIHVLTGEIWVNGFSLSRGRARQIAQGDSIALCNGIWKAEILTGQE